MTNIPAARNAFAVKAQMPEVLHRSLIMQYVSLLSRDLQLKNGIFMADTSELAAALDGSTIHQR
jgi:hypothetical protein